MCIRDRAKTAIFLSLTRQCLFLIPAVYLMPLIWGLDGIFFAFVVSDGSAILLTCCFLGWEFHQMRKKGLLPSKMCIRDRVYTALESRVVSARHYLELKGWLKTIAKQLADDIIPKSQYKKTMAAFAYTRCV